MIDSECPLRVCTFDAIAVTQIKNILLNAPRILSKEKLNSVAVFEACDKCLDELEVVGLIAKFTSLSDEGKTIPKMIGQQLVDFLSLKRR